MIVSLCLFLAGCERGGAVHEPADRPVTLDQITKAEWDRLASRKIVFGHQSVGANILEGIRALLAEHPEIRLNIVDGRADAPDLEPGLAHFLIGRNGDPRSKHEAFRAFFESHPGARDGVGLYKLCYLDIDAATDPARLFEEYKANIGILRSKYPALQIVHVTSPLTTVEGPFKLIIKRLLGRVTDRDLNAKRNEYNRLLIQEYSGHDPIFDLARIESTSKNGSRSFFTETNRPIYTLASELTSDGGHLNEVGRLVAAEQFLVLLAKLK